MARYFQFCGAIFPAFGRKLELKLQLLLANFIKLVYPFFVINNKFGPFLRFVKKTEKASLGVLSVFSCVERIILEKID